MIALLKSLLPQRRSGRPNLAANRVITIVILSWLAILTFLATRFLFDKRNNGQVGQAAIGGQNPLQQVISTPNLRTQSCSTASCHGSLTPEIANASAIRGDEYFVWRQSDPHARAYETLSAKPSREIFLRLGVDEKNLYSDSKDFQRHWNNCLGCHETNAQLLERSETLNPAKIVGEGVSCDSCHGDSEKWLHLHYRDEWKQHADASSKRMVNFYHENDPALRIKQCSHCHVGSEKGEVDHDLIAAGHPALKFEYVWYKSRLPQHWKPNRHPVKNEDGKPAAVNVTKGQTREWLIGQLVTSNAALEQLKRRASSTDPGQHWPELSEYDCFSCHHDLSRPTWRSQRLFPVGDSPDRFKSKVVIPWGNWNLELMQLLADEFGPGNSSGSNDARAFSTALRDLREAVNNRYTLTDQTIVEKSENAIDALETWLKQITQLPEDQALRLLQQMARNRPDQLISSWDRTSTILLGFAAHYQSSKEFPTALKEGMNQLRFPNQPTHFDSPRDFLSSEGTPSRTPEKWWTDRLKELADLLPNQ